MSNIAIQFDQVGKLYHLGLVGTGTLSHDLNRWWKTKVLGREDPYLKIGETNDRSKKGSSDFVWALKDISFEIEQGDVVGIIGKNGAGKSTLLKLLSRITSPTTGIIRAKGRLGSLLEVGTGFHPEMTGRENIYMNGSIMGMTRSEITRKLDEIIDFAGVERYLDTPVKRYSSGMTVRLGFAVAAFMEPEILVVDEVLAVGDAEFQKKAIGKMQDISRGGGRTVLFVSHNLPSVRSLCHNGIVLANGQIDYIGTANDCVDHYVETKNSDMSRVVTIEKRHRVMKVDKELEIVEASIENDNLHVASDEPLIFNLMVKVNNRDIEKFTIGLHFKNIEGGYVGTYVSEVTEVPKDKDLFQVRLVVRHHNLSRGRYSTNFNIGLKDLETGLRDYDVLFDVLNFEVVFFTKGKILSLWPKSWGNIILQDVEMKVI
jgi:ABC-type polysaccharide/polyol phosphate transport system ATPase subunit